MIFFHDFDPISISMFERNNDILQWKNGGRPYIPINTPAFYILQAHNTKTEAVYR